VAAFLFPSEPFSPRRVDPDFAREMAAVEGLGWPAGLVDLEALQDEQDADRAVRHAPTNVGLTIYRGWMLTPTQYSDLYTALARRGTVLINRPDQYRHTHYLPESYPVIASYTPHTVWLPTSEVPDFDVVAALLAPFGDAPIVVKDYVKSRKHEWEEACYIPSASDRAAVERVVRRFLELQGTDLNEGLVFREYVPFHRLGAHPKSGMPLSEEYRTFVLDGEPFLTTEYWEGTVYAGSPPPIEQFEVGLHAVDSRFFTADLAHTEAGPWKIVELGDGQVAGLPEHVDPTRFYGLFAAGLHAQASKNA
jgi:ATP-grasp domain, R2K clade family 3